MSFAHLVWFALVALVLSHSQIRTRLLAKQTMVNHAIGIILASLGALLLLSILK